MSGLIQLGNLDEFDALEVAYLDELNELANAAHNSFKVRSDSAKDQLIEAQSYAVNFLASYPSHEERLKELVRILDVDFKQLVAEEELAAREAEAEGSKTPFDNTMSNAFEVLFNKNALSDRELQEQLIGLSGYQSDLPAETLISRPRWTYIPTLPDNHEQLMQDDISYYEFVMSYQYPETNNWKRLIQFYNVLEGRYLEQEKFDAQVQEFITDYEAEKNAPPTQEEIDAKIVAIESQTDTEVRNNQFIESPISRGYLTEEKKQYLETMMSEAWGEIEYFIVPREYQQEADWQARDLVKREYARRLSAGELDIVEDRYSLAYTVLDYVKADSKNIARDITTEVLRYWASLDSQLVHGYETAIYYLVEDVVDAAVLEEVLKPTYTDIEYAQYLPNNIDKSEAIELVRQLRQSLEYRVRSFSEQGVLPPSMAGTAPIATRHTDFFALGKEQIKEKYGYQGFELFSERGFYPMLVQKTVLGIKIMGVMGTVDRVCDNLEKSIRDAVGLTEEELAARVYYETIEAVETVDDAIFDTVRVSLRSQEIWDSFFSYCNEVQILNQIVYLGVIHGIQGIIGKIIGKVADKAGGLEIAEIRRRYNQAVAGEASALQASNLESAYNHMVIKEFYAAKIPSMGSTLAPSTVRIVPGQYADDALSAWHYRNMASGDIPDLQDYYYGAYQAARSGDMLSDWRRAQIALGKTVTAADELNFIQQRTPVGHVASFQSEKKRFDNAMNALRNATGSVDEVVEQILNGLIPGIGTTAIGTVDNWRYDLQLRVQPAYAELLDDDTALEWMKLQQSLAERMDAFLSGEGERPDFDAEETAFREQHGISDALVFEEVINDLVASGDWERLGVPGTADESIRRLDILKEYILDIYDEPDQYDFPATYAQNYLREIEELEKIAESEDNLRIIHGTFIWLRDNVVKPLTEAEGMMMDNG